LGDIVSQVISKQSDYEKYNNYNIQLKFKK